MLTGAGIRRLILLIMYWWRHLVFEIVFTDDTHPLMMRTRRWLQ